MGTLVAVDAGRSRCRGAVIAADGRPGPVVEGPGLRPGTGPSSVDGIVEAIVATVTSAVVASGARRFDVGQIEGVSAGVAGLLRARDLAPPVAVRLHERLGAGRVVLCSDVVAAHAGAFGDGDGGVVLAAGTGAVAFGVAPGAVAGGAPDAAEGAVVAPGAVAGGGVCIDGWGHLLGDEGSGFWIGRRGLDAALRAHDGRPGGSTPLARLAERAFGPIERLPDWVGATGIAIGTATAATGTPATGTAHGTGTGSVAAIASFAARVAEAAVDGDDVARRIWSQAAVHLADTAVACARRLGPEPVAPVPLTWTGGLFRAPAVLLLEPFLARIRAEFPAADLVPPAGDALSGAARLATPAAARLALAGLAFDSAASPKAPVRA